MKKILFSANNMTIGGIETALVTLLNYLDKQNKYDITLVLEKAEGELLNNLSKNIKIIEYSPSKIKNVFIRKINNLLKRLKFIVKNKNKYDLSVAYATYSLPASFIARTVSRNNALWVHNNYLAFFDNNKNKYIEFFNKVKSETFKKIIFVSNESKNDYKEIFNTNKNLIVCNNLINEQEIIKKSNEKISFDKENKTIFLNVGRHDEKQKRLSRLLQVAKKLADDNFNFKILLVGSGNEEQMYKKMIKDLNIEQYVELLGMKKNPYPYYKISDCVVLTSEYEGYPVVYEEAFVLSKPIITTNVSDSKQDIDNKYGFVCEKNIDDIYEKMKLFLEKGFEIKEKFNPTNFNNEILKIIEQLIEGDK